VLAAAAGVYLSQRQSGTDDAVVSSGVAPIETVRSGSLEIRLISATGVLSQGRSSFVIEFRDAETGALADAGTVRAGAAMPMPGMVMSGNVQVAPSGTPGRYTASGEFGMAGAWRFTVEWRGPAGNGSVAFEGSVQ
jgi:hypothetical protein